MNRLAPTTQQIIHAAIAGIASHPLVENPNIYYPIVRLGNESSEVVKITRYRDYGGYDLDSVGLTCSVYPAYSSRTAKGSSPSLARKMSVEYKSYQLGNKHEGSIEDATYSLIVDLTYQEVSIGETTTIKYNILKSTDNKDYPLIEGYHGDRLSLEGSINTKHRDVYEHKSEVEIDTNPAEHLLRNYVDLMRLVLNDLHTIRPLAIRSSQVIGVDFPTSTWSREPSDVIFHTAYLLWEVQVYPPTHSKDLYFIPINKVYANNLQIIGE